MADSRIGKKLQCSIVLHLSVLDDTAMAVACVLAHADVGDQQQITNALANRSQRGLNDAVLVVTIRPDFVLFLRQPEENDSANLSRLRLFRDFHRVVARKVELTRHRPDLFPDVFTRAHKDWINHRLRRQSRFSHQIPEALTASEPAQSVRWKGHIRNFGWRMADGMYRTSAIRHPPSYIPKTVFLGAGVCRRNRYSSTKRQNENGSLCGRQRRTD